MRILVLALLCSATACATSPTGRRQLLLMDEEQMAVLGAQAFVDIKESEPITKDPAATSYVECISNAILRAAGLNQGQPWEVVVFESEQINAFALPGRKIGVFTGMVQFAQTPDQLAAVIGHEVGHVIARHGNERVSEQQASALAQGGFAMVLQGFQTSAETQQAVMASLGVGIQLGRTLPHSRTQEQEADTIGLRMMADAAFDPQAAVELWQMMAARGAGPPEFMSTHPAPDRRAKDLAGQLMSVEKAYQSALVQGRPSCERPASTAGG